MNARQRYTSGSQAAGNARAKRGSSNMVPATPNKSPGVIPGNMGKAKPPKVVKPVTPPGNMGQPKGSIGKPMTPKSSQPSLPGAMPSMPKNMPSMPKNAGKKSTTPKRRRGR